MLGDDVQTGYRQAEEACYISVGKKANGARAHVNMASPAASPDSSASHPIVRLVICMLYRETTQLKHHT